MGRNAAVNTAPPSLASSQMPIRTSIRERTTSSTAITANAISAASVRTRRVSSLRLVITRSKTWTMYSGTVSIRRLMTKLKAPMVRNARRQARIAPSRSDGASALEPGVSEGS